MLKRERNRLTKNSAIGKTSCNTTSSPALDLSSSYHRRTKWPKLLMAINASTPSRPQLRLGDVQIKMRYIRGDT